ncbi:MAG: indole-3-glycerol phosphate synthase TrpC, partial [Coriobacteriales bacterium]|nr:indole-3-glycerol phosphate synthase TrpC [Coriobacteriales bacterium]
MHSILEEIVADTRRRVAQAKRERPLELLPELPLELSLEQAAESLPSGRVCSLREALAEPGLSFICEVKKASPSKGLIAQEFDHLAIARSYEAAGAAAISVLTEPTFFQGSQGYLAEIAQEVSIPVLRKDFIIDEYQIYEAKMLNTQALLLIVALLDDDELRHFIAFAADLGMDALVEAHTEQELTRALAAGATIVGVNNRDLNSFEVDLSRSLTLRKLVPPEVLFVAESGIHDANDVARLASAGADAVLIGETLMRAADKAAALKALRGGDGGT